MLAGVSSSLLGPEKEMTLYRSALEDGSPGGRVIAVNDDPDHSVVAIQAANYPGEQFMPVPDRIAEFDDGFAPATETESVQ